MEAVEVGQPTRRVAAFVATARYGDLPPRVREAAKRIILDTVGCAMGAVPTDLGLVVQRLVEDQGGAPRATVIGTGQRTSVLLAAYANGRLANILDYDETFMMLGHHAHSALAGALAVCEGAGLDGKELLTAFAVGFETGARVGLYVGPCQEVDDRGRAVFWNFAGPVMGLYAACAASARALALDPGRVEQAFGICATYLPPLTPWGSRAKSEQSELPTIKYEDTGWVAEAGVMATLLAREGVTGLPNVFEGSDGLWKSIRPDGGDLPALVDGLGERWWLPCTSFKFWPCCRWIHYPLTAFEQIVRTEGLSPDEIEEVRLLTFPQAQGKPHFDKQEIGPNIVLDASFSYPHAAAMVALGVPAGPDWFAPAIVYSTEASALRRRVFTGVEPASQDPKAWGLEAEVRKLPTRAVVKARGRILTQTSEFALGDPWAGAPPLGDGELTDKFRRLARSLAPLSTRWHERVERTLESMLALEQVASVHQFVSALSPLRGLW